MQLKSSLITLAAVAALASAQFIQESPCSECAMASLSKAPMCGNLVAVDMQQLQSVFANHSVNIPGLLTAVQNPTIKSCLCQWSNGTFTPTGAAASCIAPQGTTPAVCNATEIAVAETKMAPFGNIIGCSKVSNSSTNTTMANPSPSGAKGSIGLTGSKVSIGLSLNVNYVASLVVFAAATFAGL